MKHTQPFIIASAILALAATGARADTVATTEARHTAAVEPEPIESETVPQDCRQFLEVPADSRSDLFKWNQRLSLAACVQGGSAAPATSDPAKLHELVASLDSGVQRSNAIYRDAMAHGPVRIQMMAAYGLGATSVSLMVRARSAIPRSPDLDKNLTLHRALEPLLAGYAHDAAAAFGEVDRLATQFPADASAHPVLQTAVATARSKLHELGAH